MAIQAIEALSGKSLKGNSQKSLAKEDEVGLDLNSDEDEEGDQ